jgi:hypothetical protein
MPPGCSCRPVTPRLRPAGHGCLTSAAELFEAATTTAPRPLEGTGTTRLADTTESGSSSSFSAGEITETSYPRLILRLGDVPDVLRDSAGHVPAVRADQAGLHGWRDCRRWHVRGPPRIPLPTLATRPRQDPADPTMITAMFTPASAPPSPSCRERSSSGTCCRQMTAELSDKPVTNDQGPDRRHRRSGPSPAAT